jgi:hypothetical protein
MRLHTRVLGLAFLVAGACFAQSASATAACVGFSGTADGFDKETAVTRAQAAVAEAVNQYKAQKRLGNVSVTAMRAKPQPYWRSEVWADLFYKPDIVKANSYTVCWHGVVSPYVCTSGAKACW